MTPSTNNSPNSDRTVSKPALPSPEGIKTTPPLPQVLNPDSLDLNASFPSQVTAQSLTNHQEAETKPKTLKERIAAFGQSLIQHDNKIIGSATTLTSFALSFYALANSGMELSVNSAVTTAIVLPIFVGSSFILGAIAGGCSETPLKLGEFIKDIPKCFSSMLQESGVDKANALLYGSMAFLFTAGFILPCIYARQGINQLGVGIVKLMGKEENSSCNTR